MAAAAAGDGATDRALLEDAPDTAEPESPADAAGDGAGAEIEPETRPLGNRVPPRLKTVWVPMGTRSEMAEIP